MFLFSSAYGKEGVKMTFVDRIFVGELTNTIMCEECEHVSACGRDKIKKNKWPMKQHSFTCCAGFSHHVGQKQLFNLS